MGVVGGCDFKLVVGVVMVNDDISENWSLYAFYEQIARRFDSAIFPRM